MEEIVKGFKKMVKPESVIILGVVQSVSQDNNTISARIDGLIYDNIRLNATAISSEAKVIGLPKVGSTVVLAKIEDSQEDYKALGFDTLTDVIIKLKTTEIAINERGLAIESNGFSLKTVLESFMDQVINGVVATATGPATFDPSTKLQLEKTKANLLQILK